MIKIYFTREGQTIMLPANPPRLEVSKAGNNTKTDIVKLGEINILRKPKLAEIPLEGILPASPDSPLVVDMSGYISPLDIIAFFEGAMAEKQPLGIAVSDMDIDIGIKGDSTPMVSVEEFKWYREGGDEDVYYTMRLCEYKPHRVRSVQVETVTTNAGETVAVKKIEREVTKAIPKTYTVKSGDTLWAICKKELGDGGKYPQIASLNSIADANKIKVGQVLRLG